jgi:bisphosphoglycerate-independent phosphoglycerate mutase (AlkP superfamily)
METIEQGKIMEEMNQNLYKLVDKLDNDTLLIIHSDHGAEHYMGEHYTCRQFETCSAFYFAYTKKGFHNFENLTAINNPLSEGLSDSVICATFARALNVPIPFSSSGLPLFEIL